MARILVINPNSSTHMTAGVARAIEGLPGVHTTMTAPSGPPSIDHQAHLDESAQIVLASLDIEKIVHDYDAVLVACFSVHPLVKTLADATEGRILVTGIFEASIVTTLSLLPPYFTSKAPSAWGVVTTGSFWEQHLSTGVADFLGTRNDTTVSPRKFAGVFSTGLTAGDFHGDVSADEIARRLKDATARLLASGPVGCVVMGCAGMAGLEAMIRTAAIEAYGPERGAQVYIIDGVKAGVCMLDQAATQASLYR